jgi:L-ascorbate metabolism protein UlaG (beta-lactamase superfamily)
MFVGTATTLQRLGPFTVLTDPNFLHRGQWSYFGRACLPPANRARTAAGRVAPLTAVVLSHLHGDHFDRIPARELPRRTPVLTTEHAATRLLRRGFHAPLPYRPGPGTDPLRIYISGDTVLHDELGAIRDRFPDFDLAVVHLGGTRAFGVLVALDHRGGVFHSDIPDPMFVPIGNGHAARAPGPDARLPQNRRDSP